MNQNNKTLIILAYFSAFLGVCGHASSEFFVKLSGISGVEVSVWRFGLGGFALLILCLINPSSRNLIVPLKKDFYPIVILSVFGMAFGQFLFHWALDFASVVQVATMVTVMPIGVVFVARVIEGTKITPPKNSKWYWCFSRVYFFTYRWLLRAA